MLLLLLLDRIEFLVVASALTGIARLHELRHHIIYFVALLFLAVCHDLVVDLAELQVFVVLFRRPPLDRGLLLLFAAYLLRFVQQLGLALVTGFHILFLDTTAVVFLAGARIEFADLRAGWNRPLRELVGAQVTRWILLVSFQPSSCACRKRLVCGAWLKLTLHNFRRYENGCGIEL